MAVVTARRAVLVWCLVVCASHASLTVVGAWQDIDATLAWMARQGDDAAQAVARLQAALKDGRLQALDHPFWTSPDALWDLPSDLRKRFADCDIALFKGDGKPLVAVLHPRHPP